MSVAYMLLPVEATPLMDLHGALSDACPPSPGKDKKAEPPEPGSIMEPGSHQSVAVLGIALIAMGEDIGAEMSLRQFSHLVSEPPSLPGRVLCW